MSNRLLYDAIYAKKLDPSHLSNEIRRLKKTEIIDLLQFLSGFVEIDNTKSKSNFDLIANSSLSGLESQCHSLNCRIRRLNNLIRKATLYANKVWIKNPLEKYEQTEGMEKMPVDSIRELAIKDISVLNYYKPLIDTGLFNFAKSQNHFCFNCFKSIFGEEELNKELLIQIKALKSEIKIQHSKGAKFFINELNERYKYVVEIKNADLNVFEHKNSFIGFDKLPNEYKAALKRKTKRIYQKEILNSEESERFAISALRNVVMQNWYSTNFGANYVTDQTVELNAIKKLNNLSKSPLYQNHFEGIQHVLPTITNVRIEKLIELRKEEPEAFINYRNSLDRFLNTHKSSSEVERIEAFKDEIQPHIDQLSQTIKSNKSKLIKNSITSLVTGVSMVSIAMFSGILPIAISQAVSGLAGFHQGSKLIENLIQLKNEGYENKDDKYYFLWKAVQ